MVTYSSSSKQAATVLSMFLLFVSLPAKATDLLSFLDAYTVTVGVSLRELSLDYYRDDKDLTPAGSMTEGMRTTYLLRAATPYVMSSSRNWGVFLETGLSSFNMSKQNVGNSEKDLGTSVKGNYWYVTPVAFYLFGPVPKNRNEFSLIAGVGLGLGYLSARGDMILTEDGSNERLVVDESGLDVAAGVLLELRYGLWVSRVYGGGPTRESGLGSYDIFDFSWDFGYSFSF